jgi:hypothetical protein
MVLPGLALYAKSREIAKDKKKVLIKKEQEKSKSVVSCRAFVFLPSFPEPAVVDH